MPVQQPTVVRQHDNQDRSIIPGGSGWQQTTATTSNLSRAQLTEGTVISFEITRFPPQHDGAILPLCIDIVHNDEDGDVVTVKETDRTYGMPHVNTAHNQMLTDGVLRTHTHTYHFEQFATDVAEMPTPHHYTKLVNLSNKFFSDKIEALWADAKSRMLRTLELMVRRAMKLEFPTQYNLTKDDESACRRMVFGTYAALNRWPKDWVASVYGVVVEGLSRQGFKLGNDVVGNIILAPREACVEEFGVAYKTIKPLTAHENEDPYTVYQALRFENGEVVGMATRTGQTFQVGRFTVAPYDQIDTPNDDLTDAFYERRLIPSSVVIDKDTVYAEIPSPEGRTKHTAVDLAVSAGLYYETCCLDEAKFSDRQFGDPNAGRGELYFNDDHNCGFNPLHPPFPPTVGGTWALQTDEGAAALCGWLEQVAKNTSLDELKKSIQRRTGFDAGKIDPARHLDTTTGAGDLVRWFRKTHEFLAKRLIDDEMSKKICLLALLPGSRKIMTYLHELSPFTVCNFTLQIAPWANCADLYLMHPKPMTVVTSDTWVGKFDDPTKYGVKRWRMHSRVVVFRHSTQPDLRIADAFITAVGCKMHTLSTACLINRTSRIEDGERGSDAFAIFSGVKSTYPAWCRFGQDSMTRLPCEADITEMFETTVPANHMIKMLKRGNWVHPVGLVVSDCARECPIEGWMPWQALLTKKSTPEPASLEGMGQGKWR